jgi:hypothetical protein
MITNDRLAYLKRYLAAVSVDMPADSTHVKAIAAAIAALEALPATADGVRVVPGMTLYVIGDDGELLSGKYSPLGQYTDYEGYDGADSIWTDGNEFICWIECEGDVMKAYADLKNAEAAARAAGRE